MDARTIASRRRGGGHAVDPAAGDLRAARRAWGHPDRSGSPPAAGPAGPVALIVPCWGERSVLASPSERTTGQQGGSNARSDGVRDRGGHGAGRPDRSSLWGREERDVLGSRWPNGWGA